MKKIVLLTMLALFASVNICYAATPDKASTTNPNTGTTSNLKQKSCQNIFSLINIDFSAFSPRLNATDVSLTAVNSDKADAIKPVANNKPVKVEEKEINIPQKDKTSFFRIDLLKVIKIKID